MKSVTIQLKALQSFWVKWNQKAQLSIKLKQKNAEIYGEELPFNLQKIFKPPCNFVIFTWKGCTLQISSTEPFPDNQLPGSEVQNQKSYQSYRQPIQEIYNLRIKARQQKKKGPILLITGKPGKHLDIMPKFLINYACKFGGQPIFIDLNASNEIGLNQSIGMAVCKNSYPSDFFEIQSKILFTTSEQFKSELFLLQTQKLSKLMKNRLQIQLQNCEQFIDNDVFDIWCSGAIIKAPIFTKQNQNQKNELLKRLIDQFEVNNVLVIKDKQTQIFLKKLKQIKIHVGDQIEYPESKADRTKVYFEGMNKNIKNQTVRVPLKDLKIYKIKFQNHQPFVQVIDLKVKLVITIVKYKSYLFLLEPQSEIDKFTIAKNILSTPIMFYVQISKYNQNNNQIEVLMPGSYQHHLTQYTWVFNNITYS